MKICLINNLYKPFEKGGAERVVEIIAEGLLKEGHEVFVITSRPGNFLNSFNKILSKFFSSWSVSLDKIQRKEEKKMIYDNKIRVEYINSLYFILSKIPFVLRIFWHFWDEIDFVSALRVRHIIKKEKPDIVMTHNLKGISYLVLPFLGRLKVKKIHLLHDIQLLHPSGLMIFGQEEMIDSPLSKLYQAINIKLFKNIDLVISPSKWLMNEHLRRNFFKDTAREVLPNPVGERGVELVREKEVSDIFRFLYIGHLSEAKGALLLLEAFEKLIKGNPDRKVELLLAGENLLAKKQPVLLSSESVKVLGFVNREKINRLLKEADCLIMPSLCYENSPTVIYEAALFGLPVVSSRIGGATELCEVLGGKLFIPGDVKSLVEKMEWAIKKPAELEEVSQLEILRISRYDARSYVQQLIQYF